MLQIKWIQILKARVIKLTTFMTTISRVLLLEISPFQKYDLKSEETLNNCPTVTAIWVAWARDIDLCD